MKTYLLIIVIFLLGFLNTNAQNYPLKVAILGNSIVGHGPAPEIGWKGDWGMAASAKERDFVRLIEKDLKNISQNIEVKELNIADFERNYQGYNLDNANLNNIKNFNPDILVLRLGDNIEDWNMDIPDFHKYLQGLVKYIANNRSMRVVVTNSFWSSATRDYAFQSFIEKYGYRFVDLRGLYDDKTNTAQGLFTDIGVAKHPSDKGMQAIKDRIWKELSREVDDLICNYYKRCDYCQEGDYVGYLDVASCDTISGWVLDKNNLERLVEVEVWVDDKPYINLLAKEDYPSLQKVYGQQALKHGFKYAIPVGATLRDGLPHIIKVKPCWKEGKFIEKSGKIITCSKPEPPKVETPDYVSGWVSSECNEIIGWIYDKNNLSKAVKVDFILNDKYYKTLEANLQRPDLLAQLSNSPDATKHIFIATLSSLPKGTSTAFLKLTESSKTVGSLNVFQCPKVVLSSEESIEDGILIFPNPNTGDFKIILPKNLQNSEIQLFDSKGIERKFIFLGEQIQMKGQLKGVYFLKVSKEEKSYVRKIIVE
jgi:Secretion system C-terminal sorting domain